VSETAMAEREEAIIENRCRRVAEQIERNRVIIKNVHDILILKDVEKAEKKCEAISPQAYCLADKLVNMLAELESNNIQLETIEKTLVEQLGSIKLT